MKPISKVPLKGLVSRQVKALAENQNEMAEAVNYLLDKMAKKPKRKSKAKSKTKGDQT